MRVELVDVSKLELEDGDILLVRHPNDWTSEQVRRLHVALQEVISRAGRRVTPLYGPKEVEFQIVRREAA